MKKGLAEKILAIGITLVGIAAIVFGILCLSEYIYFPEGSSAYKEVYGGDAYTGIQNAVVITANNIKVLNQNLEEFASLVAKWMGFLLLIVGALLFVVGIAKMISAFKKETKVIENTQSITDVKQ